MILKASIMGMLVVLVIVVYVSCISHVDRFVGEMTTGTATGTASTVGNSSSASYLGPPLPSASTPQSASKPNRLDITPDTDMSKTTQQAMHLKQQSDFLRDLQTMIRNELRVARATDASTIESDGSCDDTAAISQGKEYASNMIKKDSIPCWGCSLDY